jgi:hypothetical protein
MSGDKLQVAQERPEAQVNTVHATREIPPAIEALADKERINEKGQGPPLRIEEKADLVSWRRFPDDPNMRALDRRDILAGNNSGPPLNVTDKAKLEGRKEFPKSAYLAGLAEQQFLARANLWEVTPLTAYQKTQLAEARALPPGCLERPQECGEQLSIPLTNPY